MGRHDWAGVSVLTDGASMTDLKTTPLGDLHRELGAKMVPFAGYDMPVTYPMGLMEEHKHCRNGAGLFDVSHMGQIEIRAKTGTVEDAAQALERLVPIDVLGLAHGRQRYAFFTNDNSGIEDDLMVTRQVDHLFLVVNAACKQADVARLRDGLPECDVVLHSDRGLLALQGPKAEAVLGEPAAAMRFMGVQHIDIAGVSCLTSRSGYTGLDGYEISMPADQTEKVARALLDHTDVAPIGLGARDSLRLEASLCLYGQDLTPQISPIEAGLNWAIQKVRRKGGERAGGFPGADRILTELETGPARRRVGLRPDGRAPVRAGAALFASETSDTPIGTVTSGGFGPSVGAPISMGYIEAGTTEPNSTIFAEVRGRRLAVALCKLPFIPATFKR